MGKISTIFFIGLFSTFSAIAQTDAAIQLRTVGKTLLEKNVPDSVKIKNADIFIKAFEAELAANGPDWVNSESLPFVSRLTSENKQTEIFTWTLKRAEDSFHSYGLVWTKDKKKSQPKIFRLDDKSETLKNTETKNLGRTNWLGCVYYSIIDLSKGNNRKFLLLGFGGHTPQVRRKVAEILTFNNVGDVQFGLPVFEKEKKKFNRVVLEYNSKVSVSMKYNADAETLYYDYLAPESPLYLGNPAFYGPDGTHDAFVLKGGKFTYIRDADARNLEEGLGDRSKKVERKLPPR